MVKVTAREYIKAECVDEFLSKIKVLVEKTNALDPGCIRYELCRDVSNPLNFVMLEEWEDQASLDAHMKAAHFTETVPSFGPMTSQPTDITILEKVY